MSNTSNIFEQAFGTDNVESKHEQVTDFIENDANDFDETIKAMHIESKQADRIAASIDNALDEAQNPVTLGTAQESLHNMQVIGMDRLLKLRNSNQYTTESVAMVAIGVAVAAAVVVIVGLIIKYMEYMNEFVGGNKEKIGETRRNMGATIEDYETKWKSKFAALASNPSDERVKSFTEDLKHEVSRISHSSESIIYQIVHEGIIGDRECKDIINELKRPYDLMSDLAEKTVELKDELNKKIDELKDPEKETDAAKKKEMEKENKTIIVESLKMIDKFYKDNYRIYNEVLPINLINHIRKFFKHFDRVPTTHFPDSNTVDAKALVDYFRSISNGINESRDVITSSTQTGTKKLTLEEISKSKVAYDNSEDYSNELKELEKKIGETADRFEKYEREFKGDHNSLFKNITKAKNDHGAASLEKKYKEMFQYFNYITKSLAGCVSVNIKYINAITVMHKNKESALILKALVSDARNEPTLDKVIGEITKTLNSIT